MQTLIGQFMKPVAAPSGYGPASDVVSTLTFDDGLVVAEVYSRGSGMFGFRFSAWVAGRDAGDAVRSHSWWHPPSETTIADSICEAESTALRFATSKGLTSAGDWQPAANRTMEPTR